MCDQIKLIDDQVERLRHAIGQSGNDIWMLVVGQVASVSGDAGSKLRKLYDNETQEVIWDAM